MAKPSDEKILTEEQIAKRVDELAKEISARQKDGNLLVIGILKGSFIFVADLLRRLTCPVTCEFIRVAMDDQPDSNEPREIQYDAPFDVEGKDVLIVEDILDTGITINYLKEHFLSKNPNSLQVCVLLDKVDAHKTDVEIDYIGFPIPNKFVVGYGLDYQERYRELPYITYIEGVNWPLNA